MFGWFVRKKEVEQVREDARKGFDFVKKDIHALSGWIKHLDSEKDKQNLRLEEVKEVLSTIQEEIEGLKNVVSVMGSVGKSKQLSKTATPVSNKQTVVYTVQTGVETAVQTPNLEQFSVTERAILWVLLNADMNLSYNDLAAMLGKERSTIRGQINAIKSKSEIIHEKIEKNGKKRIYIPEEIREKMLKKPKVRVRSNKKSKKR